MPRLILLNGPPAAGKSTLARRWVEEHPLSLNLDIDRIRDLVGGGVATLDTGIRARVLALAVTRAQLQAGGDVIVPQYLGRVEFIEQLARLAAELDVPFIELVVSPSRDAALARFAARTDADVEPGAATAAAMAQAAGGEAALIAMYDQLQALIDTRPNARRVESIDGDPDASYALLCAAINGS